MLNSSKKITYDPKVDALYIYGRKGKVFKTLEINDGMYIDIDKNGGFIGIEILDASHIFDKKALEKKVLLI